MDVENYLQFSVWSAVLAQDDDIHFQLNDLNKKTVTFDLRKFLVIAPGPGGSSVYQLSLDKNETFSFEEGDVFGIRQSENDRSKVALLHQMGEGLSYQAELNSGNFHNMMFTTSTVLTEINIYPLIAIETGKSLIDFCMHFRLLMHACEKSVCSDK